MKTVDKKMTRYVGLSSISLFIYLSIIPIELAAVRFTRSDVFGIDQSVIAETLTQYASRNEYPVQLRLAGDKREYQATFQYTFDKNIQSVLEKLYQRYRPDFAAFVAIEPKTGDVIALSSWEKKDTGFGNLALRNEYPAASIFKIITAAAALDQGKVEPDTVIPFNGKSTSLYKKQVFRHRETKWTRRPTLIKAFAESVNPVFAQLGVFHLGAATLQQYAERFWFNRDLGSDLTVDPSTMSLTLDDEWALAESAAGYTLANTLSPWHGAMLASAVVNDGVMMRPHVVEIVTDEDGLPLYTNEPQSYPASITPQTARKLRRLMQETVQRGSARHGFRRFFRGRFKDIEVGGKTGSLTGISPKGRNDWFVGYARLGDRKIAYASLTINKERWTVKSAFVARKVIEAYYSSKG